MVPSKDRLVATVERVSTVAQTVTLSCGELLVFRDCASVRGEFSGVNELHAMADTCLDSITIPT